jgi:Raf kinase inhibitor-like YbhB/YbcL family protein
MKLSSPAFKHNESIPRRYTCQGEELSPPLHIEGVPSDAKSLVLMMDDPDVPKSLRADGLWDHWILFNVLPTVKMIEENKPPLCKMGKTTSGTQGYEGPCPPDKEHRYFFKLYALSKMLELPSGSTKKEIEKAMQGHILTQCELMGRYVKS